MTDPLSPVNFESNLLFWKYTSSFPGEFPPSQFPVLSQMVSLAPVQYLLAALAAKVAVVATAAANKTLQIAFDNI
jgi:hypothetical protein